MEDPLLLFGIEALSQKAIGTQVPPVVPLQELCPHPAVVLGTQYHTVLTVP